jgi:hypothetical protein
VKLSGFRQARFTFVHLVEYLAAPPETFCKQNQD